MPTQGDVFDPGYIRGTLRNLLNSASAKADFDRDWDANVSKRVSSWKSHKDNKTTPQYQLEWEAHIVEYVSYMHSKVAVHRNTTGIAKDTLRPLARTIPLIGPRFLPLPLSHVYRRHSIPEISPELVYLSSLTVVHPIYYPIDLKTCPKCSSQSVHWDSWNATGSRLVYGIRANERAIGYQMRCKSCAEKKKTAPKSEQGGYCFATTSHIFWEPWQHWKIPRSVPMFLKRSAVTHELFDLIVELRPGSTAAGISEHIKQLHLLEYRQQMLEYLQYFQASPSPGIFSAGKKKELRLFSAPTDENGYGDSYISDDLIGDLYANFIANARKAESIEYCMTRTAKCISLDNTFKSSAKATLVDASGLRQNPMKGGILSSINEEGEGLSWRYCLSASPAETKEMLEDLGKRHDALGVARPAAVIVDNCCQVRRFVQNGIGKSTAVALDVYHFIIRYSAGIHNGAKNPRRREVLADIRDAIIKTGAMKNKPATYWTQAEQEKRIQDAYGKWLDYGGIWSNAAAKIHSDQLTHVRKGCLARIREDICMDGSRIEGSHKGWNGLQRAQPSGIEVYTSLAFDFFHRRNIRIGFSRIANRRFDINLPDFVASTFSSHHIQIVSFTAALFNSLIPPANTALQALPTLPTTGPLETMGLVESQYSLTCGGLLEPTATTAAEPMAAEQPNGMLDDVDVQIQDIDAEWLMQALNVTEQQTRSLLQSGGVGEHPRIDQRILQAVPAPTERSLQKRKERPQDFNLEAMRHSVGRNAGDIAPSDVRKRMRYGNGLPESQAHAHIDAPTGDSESGSETPPAAVGARKEPPSTLMDCEPCNDVTETTGGIRLPLACGSDNASAAGRPGSALYSFQTVLNKSLALSRPSQENVSPAVPGPSRHTQTMPENIQQPLPLIPRLKEQGLTRSQILFSVGTAVDPRSLKITADYEFFLFMKCRADNQWTTFGMTTAKWSAAVEPFNQKLKAICAENGIAFIPKIPRALSDKLNDVEPKIIERIARQNYTSKSGSEKFWREHCAAVPALVGKAEASVENGSIAAGPTNEPRKKKAVCSRCGAVMYPGGAASKALNHKKGYCADGAPQVPTEKEPPSSLPPWPQPRGIFIRGKSINATALLRAVRDLYEKVADPGRSSPSEEPSHTPSDYTPEDAAFSKMLSARIIVKDGHSFFALHGLTLADPEPGETSCTSLVSDVDGVACLRIDCLNDT